jgi:hypothetical protein
MSARFWTAVTIAVVAAAVPATAHARPADVTIVNPNPIDVAVTGPVKIDSSQNEVKIDPSQNTVKVQPQERFHAYNFIPAPSAAGGKSCTSFAITAGTHARLDAVSVTTYNDAGAIAYLRYFVKEASSTSRILSQRILTNAVGSDPVANSRSGVLAWGMHIAGGNVFDVQDGEVHSLTGCIQSSAGASATGTFMLDGVTE